MGRYTAAVIGLGQMGLTYDLDPKREKPSAHVLAYHLHPDIELVATADVRVEQGKALAKIAPEAKFYPSMAELLQHHAVDIVSICTPPAFHLSAIQDLLQYAKNTMIFCEKPVVSSVVEANLLREQLQGTNCLLVPNLTRRWNSGMQRIKAHILSGEFGELQKIHVRYTRGIYNTGAHIFDLLHWWVGEISEVQVSAKVKTSAEEDNELSFTFAFQIGKNVVGFAEAFDDDQYYLFEIDLYFTSGKIEIRNSGDDVLYYQVAEHHLFSGFKSLYLKWQERKLLAESNLGNAVSHLVKVLDGLEQPICRVDDGIYPLYVAEALLRSYHNNCCRERVRL